MVSSAERHVADFHFGELLAVPGVTPVARAPREPEDADLLALAVPPPLARYPGALHHRGAGVDLLAVARQQHPIERHRGPGLGVELGHLDRSPRLGPELLAAGDENGVRHRGRNVNRGKMLVKPRRTAR